MIHSCCKSILVDVDDAVISWKNLGLGYIDCGMRKRAVEDVLNESSGGRNHFFLRGRRSCIFFAAVLLGLLLLFLVIEKRREFMRDLDFFLAFLDERCLECSSSM